MTQLSATSCIYPTYYQKTDAHYLSIEDLERSDDVYQISLSSLRGLLASCQMNKLLIEALFWGPDWKRLGLFRSCLRLSNGEFLITTQVCSDLVCREYIGYAWIMSDNTAGCSMVVCYSKSKKPLYTFKLNDHSTRGERNVWEHIAMLVLSS
ncbi:MAG: hypothetical protein MI864_20230 [Pseudomonadales bacterium]|nr:hypothetical protein [Pseudomonadales bacterium]